MQDVKTVRIMCGVCFESENTQMRSGVPLIPEFAVEIPAGGRGYPIGLSKVKKNELEIMISIRNNKRTILRFTVTALAVLLFCGVFCGAAAADYTFTAEEWNALGSDSNLINGSITITGGADAVIYPKFNGTSFTPSIDVTIDFSGYSGTFAGETVDSGGNKGALFGCVQIAPGKNLTIKNLKMESVNVTASSSGTSYFGGIVGQVCSASTSSLIFENCTLENCRVYAGNDVGGLVGYTYSVSVDATDCNLLHCDITAGGEGVGGLVGYADSYNNVDVNATDCIVANCSVASTGDSNVGGLVGNTENTHVYITSCKVENTLVYADTIYDNANAGGLVGYAHSKTSIETSNVTNCVIASGKAYVGGLIGYAYHPDNSRLSGNMVEKCTVAGSKNVSGLVGSTAGNTFESGSTDNTVDSCAVKGGEGTNLVCGYPTNALVCDAEITKNYINNNTDPFIDTIDFKDMDDIPITDLSNYLDIGKVVASSTQRSGPTFSPVTSLGQHGTVGGYGVVVDVGPMYTVTVEGGIQNGTIKVNNRDSVTVQEGRSVTVTATPNPGYHLNWTYWKNETTGNMGEIGSGSFTMPGYDVIVGGDFKVNVTNVTYYNQTELFDSKLNTYQGNTNATDKTNPTRIGYDFAGWNVSDGGAWYPFNSINYNNTDGKWNYTGAHYTGVDNVGILKVYANWTPYTYNVTFNKTSGTGTMENQTFTYGEKKALSPNLFSKTGYYFAGWNKTSADGTVVDYNNKEEVKNLNATNKGTVTLYAVWEINPPAPQSSSSSSRNYGASVWLQETAAPTAAPTAEPTAEPTQAVPTASPVKPVQTSASPLPVAGVLAGLGAAALVFGLRRK